MRLKSSGILRYFFGSLPQPSTGIFPALSDAPGAFVNVLGGPGGVATPDVDNQAFGVTAGSPGVLAGFGAFAFAAPIAAWDRGQVGLQSGGQPETNIATLIPASSRISAWFQPGSFSGAVPAPLVNVRTVNAKARINGVDIPGAKYLTFAQVAISAVDGTTPGGTISGCLYVKLEHSLIDVPGNDPTPDAIFGILT